VLKTKDRTATEIFDKDFSSIDISNIKSKLNRVKR
jgi:hypothetical protein